MKKLIQGIINHENGAAAKAVSVEDVIRALAMNRGIVPTAGNNNQNVKLDILQKPGSDIVAQLAGFSGLMPR